MINIKKLQEYMNRSEIGSIDTLADKLGEDRTEVRAYFVAADMPLSLCERIAKLLGIPSEKWGEIFFADPAQITLAPSIFSIQIPQLDEEEILGSFQTLRGEHNVLDELLAAWQFTGCYSNERPENLKEAVEAAMKAIPADAFPEELVAGVEDAATMHGFALGVQFALSAMQHNGPIMTMLRQGLGI